MSKKRIWILYFALCFLVSCETRRCPKNNKFKTKIEISNKCFLDHRKTVKNVIGLEGTIKAKTSNIYLIETVTGVKYFPCNLPESLKKDGVKIYFCGKKKKEKPTEKVIANLLKITSLYVE